MLLLLLFIENKTCDSKQCEHGCRMTGDGPTCFCQDGQQPEKSKCVGKLYYIKTHIKIKMKCLFSILLL